MRIAQACAGVNVDNATQRCGAVLWAAPFEGVAVWLSWTWHEVRSGVIVMEDPMTLKSNVELVDTAGLPLPEESRILHLNAALYRLPWQRAVLKATATEPHSSVAA